MKAKHQRLTLALLALAAVIGAALLALSALKDQASFFYAPSDVVKDGLPLGKVVRLGGIVEAGSIKHLSDGISIRFVVTDGKAVVPVRVATGEHVANAVVFKQLLQAGAVDVVQIDACRVAGVNENIAIMLLAAKFGVPVCPHAGGVGLCELVQHLAMFDFVAIGGSWDGRYVEYVDHLHEHFVDPTVLRNGRYVAPSAAGSGAQMRPESVTRYSYPHGAAWAER